MDPRKVGPGRFALRRLTFSLCPASSVLARRRAWMMIPEPGPENGAAVPKEAGLFPRASGSHQPAGFPASFPPLLRLSPIRFALLSFQLDPNRHSYPHG